MARAAQLTRPVALALLLVAWGSAAAAVPAPAQPPALEQQVRAIASRLRCPVCQNESVADSPSGLAGQMRALIRTKLEEGQSPEEIVAYFVSRYGQWILLDPPRKGVGWILWTAPVVVLFAALVVAAAFLRRTVRPEEATADSPESGGH